MGNATNLSIFSLNTNDWRSDRQRKNLYRLIESQKWLIDIFCFQEVGNGKWIYPWKNILVDLVNMLSEYNCYDSNCLYYATWCIVTFIKKELWEATIQTDVLAIQSLHWKNINCKFPIWMKDVGLCLSTTLNLDSRSLTILNIHGVRYPWHKLDCSIREKQKNALLSTLKRTPGKHIIVWDFNQAPSTKLIQVLSQKYININTLFDFSDTRGPWCPFYWKDNYQPYADYWFIDKSITPLWIAFTDDKEENIVSDHRWSTVSIIF